jgi:hypothetical protein
LERWRVVRDEAGEIPHQKKPHYSVLNSVPLKIHVPLEPQNVTLLGNRVFADVIS